MERIKNTLITAAIIAVFIYVPYMFGSVLYDDDKAVFLWFKGVFTILGIIGATSLISIGVMMIHTTVKNWKV